MMDDRLPCPDEWNAIDRLPLPSEEAALKVGRVCRERNYGASGTFGRGSTFGNQGEASGTFVNCVAGSCSFGQGRK